MPSLNKNVLLISPSGWQKESINLGLAYLASSLKQAGFSVLILDLNRYEMSDAELIKRVGEYAPFLVGFSVKTATANEGGRLAALLAKHYPEATYIAGGPHITLCAEEYMKEHPVFSYVTMGEGEVVNVELAKALLEKEPVVDIPGVVWKNAGFITVNEWAPPQLLDSLPYPDLDAIEGFSWEGFRYPVVTSRGCPFLCTYCCVNKLTGSGKWRFRSAENVLDELEFVAQAKGITAFEIWDDNFTLDINRAKEICRGIIERGLELSWYCHNGIRADRIDTELAELMKKAGCTSVAFGMETGNPETFDSIKKGEPLSAVVNAVEIVKKAGIKAVGYFIIGLPGDTLESFVETVRFQRKLKLDHYVYGMLIPYPKTEVWDVVNSHGSLLCDITETQHFSDDVVPVSFELPEFPKKDMVRAYYIAQYMDLFEAVDRVARKGRSAHVVYVAADQYLENHLSGMVLAAHDNVTHTVVTGRSRKSLESIKGFSQIAETTNIAVSSELPKLKPQSEVVYVCVGGSIPRSVIFGNANIVLLNPQRPLHLTVQVRRFVPVPLLPQLIPAVVGTGLAGADVLGYFGWQKIKEVFLIQVVNPAAALLRGRYNSLQCRLAPLKGRLAGASVRIAGTGGKLGAWRALLVQKRADSLTAPQTLRALIRSAAGACMNVGRTLAVKGLNCLVGCTGLSRRVLVAVAPKISAVISIKRFCKVKRKLFSLKHKTNKFPFDDYTSYM